MAAAIETHQGPPPPTDGHEDNSTSGRIVPIHPPTIQASAPSPGDGDPMEITTPDKSGAASPSHKHHDGNSNGARDTAKNTSPTSQGPNNVGSMPAPPATAAAAVHQPKIVQTAFIHKLYK